MSPRGVCGLLRPCVWDVKMGLGSVESVTEESGSTRDEISALTAAREDEEGDEASEHWEERSTATMTVRNGETRIEVLHCEDRFPSAGMVCFAQIAQV